MYATVTDERGEPVTGLTARDFQVRTGVLLSKSPPLPRLVLASRAAASLIEALRGDEEVTLVAIGSGIEPLARPAKTAGWHAIDVRVDRPGVRVRARDGYDAR